MISTLVSHCDCCGLSIGPQVGDECPRCGYPVTLPKEERFLESSVHDLQRVAAYGGANITVTQLMQRYRARLHRLQQLKQAPAPLVEKAKAVEAPGPVAQPTVPPMVTQSTVEPVAPATIEGASAQPVVLRMMPLVLTPVNAVPVQQEEQQAPARVFSL